MLFRSSPNRMILSQRRGAIYTKVSDLIDPITGSWDEELLRSLFLSIDVSRILQIPLNTNGFEDFVGWKYTKHGKYTVRSGYHLQWRHQFGPSAGQLALPGSSSTNPVWKSLWQLRIPSKVKIFIWRALHGILPLKCILANRHVGTSGACPICNQGPEDIRHLLFQCQIAQDMWNSLGLMGIIDEAMQGDRAGSAVLEILLRRQDNDYNNFDNVGLKELISVTSWYLWWIRRRHTHNEDVPQLFRCKMSVLSIVANATKASKPSVVEAETKWVRPEPRHVKLNVDASFHVDS